MHTTSAETFDGVCRALEQQERLSLAAALYAVEQASTQPVTHAQVAAMAKTVLALALGSAAAFSPNAAPRATTIVKSDPNIKTDVGSGWKPESGGFSSTDTPDFFYDDDAAPFAFTDDQAPTI